MGGGSLRNLSIGLGLDRMYKVRELHGILYEEDRDVVPDNV
jgi:hypothetical protein